MNESLTTTRSRVFNAVQERKRYHFSWVWNGKRILRWVGEPQPNETLMKFSFIIHWSVETLIQCRYFLFNFNSNLFLKEWENLDFMKPSFNWPYSVLTACFIDPLNPLVNKMATFEDFLVSHNVTTLLPWFNGTF